MKKENKIKNEKTKKNKLRKNHFFLIAMIFLLIGVAGAGTILSNNNEVEEDNNIKPANSINNNTTENNETPPKEEYALITIHGLKCHVKTEYTDFIYVTEDTEYEGMDGYYELTKEKSVDFVDYRDFAQFFTRDGKFRIEVSKSLKEKNPIDYNNDTDTSKNITVNGNNVSVTNIKKYSDQNVIDEEYTFVFFKVKDKYVELGWAGDTVDMYVIESFFKLN